jgi:hypothetical protein
MKLWLRTFAETTFVSVPTPHTAIVKVVAGTQFPASGSSLAPGLATIPAAAVNVENVPFQILS